jgi:hypothetical protein
LSASDWPELPLEDDDDENDTASEYLSLEGDAGPSAKEPQGFYPDTPVSGGNVGSAAREDGIVRMGSVKNPGARTAPAAPAQSSGPTHDSESTPLMGEGKKKKGCCTIL